MSFGQILQEEMNRMEQTQEDAAKVAMVSNSMISKIARGNRKPPRDVMKRIVNHYDEPQLAIAAQEEVTGGACSPWLNGADLHKSTVHLKALEEVHEAYEAMSLAPITKRRDQLNDKDLKTIKSAIMESVEAITALTHYVAVLCKEYCFSWIGVWKEHRQQLKASKYLK